MGWVGSWYGLVWFGQNSEAEFKTMNQSINHKGGYRAARAAKKSTYSNLDFFISGRFFGFISILLHLFVIFLDFSDCSISSTVFLQSF